MPADRPSFSRALVRFGAMLALALAVACGGKRGAPVRVTIPPRATMGAAADSLARTGIIRSARLFRFYASIRRSDRAIKPGTYLFRRGTSWSELLDALRGGKGIIATVTIPEGWELTKIVPQLALRLGVPIDSVQAAVRDTALLRELDVPTKTLEGYLFPDTYTFMPGTTARAAVRQMVQRFEQVWKPEWTARLDSVAMSRHDILTLASIVEREAVLPEERPVIAAVYLNRLRDGQLLQADPTVQYALGQHQARLYYKDLEVESPYNTYRHKGLPPGPIASPGAPSIEAALYPARVPYKFFVAFPDGHHEFRTDYSQHTRAVEAARQARDSAQRRTDTAGAGASRPAAPSTTPTRRIKPPSGPPPDARPRPRP